MKRIHIIATVVLACLLSACTDLPEQTPVFEVIKTEKQSLSLVAMGTVKSTKATPLLVPGQNWSTRQLIWMRPEGELVKAGEVVARFSAERGKLELAQAQIDLERNAVARTLKEADLGVSQGRIGVDLAQVDAELNIARRYAKADLQVFARNQILDAVQDEKFLGNKREVLDWRRGQSDGRGQAELAVLDSQRARVALTADQKKSDLDALEIKAPNDGIFMLSADWGGEKPKIGATLYAGMDFGSLPDSSSMQVELSVPQIEAQGIVVGAQVRLYPEGRPDQAFTSTISQVDGGAQAKDRRNPVKYVSMKANIPKAVIVKYRFVSSQRFRANIFSLLPKNTLSVANIAVVSEAGKNFVEVSTSAGGEFKRKEVTLGEQGIARTIVSKGLSVGDFVSLTPQREEEPAASSDKKTVAKKFSAEQGSPR
jgi:HlyD family secretion protein